MLSVSLAENKNGVLILFNDFLGKQMHFMTGMKLKETEKLVECLNECIKQIKENKTLGLDNYTQDQQ